MKKCEIWDFFVAWHSDPAVPQDRGQSEMEELNTIKMNRPSTITLRLACHMIRDSNHMCDLNVCCYNIVLVYFTTCRSRDL